jgi:hypothetical protein
MKYVLDASAALPWVLPEKDSAKATRLPDEARNAVHELLAPDIFPAEVFSALLKAERTKRINVGEAKTLYASVAADIPALRHKASECPGGEIATSPRYTDEIAPPLKGAKKVAGPFSERKWSRHFFFPSRFRRLVFSTPRDSRGL